MCNATDTKKDTMVATKKEIHHGSSTLTTSTAASSFASFDEDDDNLSSRFTIPYTVALPLLVMMDMIGVALVVPLLSSRYYQLAGVTSAVQREWLSSIYSSSQIVGGLAIGALADSKALSRHTILLTSFLGSAFAYAMIMKGGLTAILISRVTVGLVKQTMTVSSSIMSHSTLEHERATHMGRLGASVTVAWIVGPSVGAYLYSHVGTYAPIYVSCSLFLLNSLVVLFFLPKEEDHEEESHDKKKEKSEQSAAKRILSNFQACFRSGNQCLASTVMALLLFQWVFKTTSYKNISTYYETHYGMEPHQRGYMQSYQSALSFIVQSSLVKPILQYMGGEVNAACAAALLMAIACFAELQVTFNQYLVLICPLYAVGIAILGVSLKSNVSKMAPKAALGSVFATIDVLQNVAMVTVPFYRTLLFSWTQPSDANPDVTGDPDPNQWLMASGLHWAVATAAFFYLLLQGSPCAKDDEKKREESDKVKTS